MTLKLVGSDDDSGPDGASELADAVAARTREEHFSGLIVIAISEEGVDLSHTLMPRNELYWHLQNVARHILSEE